MGRKTRRKPFRGRISFPHRATSPGNHGKFRTGLSHMLSTQDFAHRVWVSLEPKTTRPFGYLHLHLRDFAFRWSGLLRHLLCNGIALKTDHHRLLQSIEFAFWIKRSLLPTGDDTSLRTLTASDLVGSQTGSSPTVDLMVSPSLTNRSRTSGTNALAR
jgi:hypothetical protein